MKLTLKKTKPAIRNDLHHLSAIYTLYNGDTAICTIEKDNISKCWLVWWENGVNLDNRFTLKTKKHAVTWATDRYFALVEIRVKAIRATVKVLRTKQKNAEAGWDWQTAKECVDKITQLTDELHSIQ